MILSTNVQKNMINLNIFHFSSYQSIWLKMQIIINLHGFYYSHNYTSFSGPVFLNINSIEQLQIEIFLNMKYDYSIAYIYFIVIKPDYHWSLFLNYSNRFSF